MSLRTVLASSAAEVASSTPQASRPSIKRASAVSTAPAPFPTLSDTPLAPSRSEHPSGSSIMQTASGSNAAALWTGGTALATKQASAALKKGSRESRRRATHSQIERRRREKINDRLITLRNLVPACRALMRGQNADEGGDEEENDEDGDGLLKNEDERRKRKRRKAEPVKSSANQEEELGLHKLDVLTHAIGELRSEENPRGRADCSMIRCRLHLRPARSHRRARDRSPSTGAQDGRPRARRRGGPLFPSSATRRTRSRPARRGGRGICKGPSETADVGKSSGRASCWNAQSARQARAASSSS